MATQRLNKATNRAVDPEVDSFRTRHRIPPPDKCDPHSVGNACASPPSGTASALKFGNACALWVWQGTLLVLGGTPSHESASASSYTASEGIGEV